MQAEPATPSMSTRVVVPVPRSIRPGVIPVALAGVAAIGMLVYLLQARGILIFLLAVAFGALGALCVVRPTIGLVALLLCAGFVRVSVGTGTDSPLVASLVVACGLLGAWFLHQALNHRPLMTLPRVVAYPGLALVAFTCFSLLWGRITLDPRVTYYHTFIQVQLAAGALVLVSVGLLFVGGDLLRSRGLRATLVGMLIVVGFIALPFRMLTLSLPLVNTGGIFGIWFVGLCWAIALGNTRLNGFLRVLLGGGAIGWLVMATFVEGDWVSGWLPAFVAFLGVTLAIRPRIGLVLVLASVVAGAAYYSVFYSVLVTQQEQQGSLGGEFGRIELWRRNLSAIRGHILFGTGPAGYALYYITFFPTQAMSTHSNFVDTLAQFGIGGLVSLCGLLGGLWLMVKRTLRRLTNPFDRAVCAAIVGGLPAVAFSLWLGDWLIPFVYNQTIAGFDHSVYTWLMFAIGCGLWAQLERPLEGPADA
jgi:hypothetical protein